MEPDYEPTDGEDAEAAAMAAAMGFSSFGSHKPPAKRRKFNAATDAYVEGDELARIDKGGKKGQGSGGNTVPLGRTRVFEAKPVVGSEEIDLEEEGDDDEVPRYIDTSAPPPVESGGSYVQRYTQTRPPGVSDKQASEVQARIDALVAGAGEGSSVPGSGSEPRATFGDTAFMLGSRPPGSVGGFNDGSSMTSSKPERGQRNPRWYVDYYDPSFNENPWRKLERDMGLEPLGRWPNSQGAGKAR